MSRILKRPMFRIGGAANDGIISMAQPRRNYNVGSDYRKKIEELRPILTEAAGPGPSAYSDFGDLLISGGLNLLSGKGAGKGNLGAIAEAYKDPYAAFAKARSAEDAFKRQINLAAATQAISSTDAERLQRMKLEAATAEEARKLKLAEKESFMKGPLGTSLGASADFVFETLSNYKQKGIPFYSIPLPVNQNNRVDVSKGRLDSIPQGHRFYDTRGRFYVKTGPSTYDSIYASGESVVLPPPAVKEKSKIFENFENYISPRQFNKQRFLEELANRKREKTAL